MRKLALVLCLVFTATLVRAQDPSLIPRDLERLDSATTDIERMDLFKRIAFNYADMDPAKGVEYGLRGLAIAERTGNMRARGDTRNTLGYCYTRLSRFNTADSLNKLAMSDLVAAGDACAEALCWYNRGMNEQMQGRLPSTLENLLKADEKGKGCPEERVRSIWLYGLGSVYEAMQHWTDAMRCYTDAFSIDSARHDTARLAKEHIAIANIHGSLDQLDDAMEHYRLSIQCSQAVGDTLMTGYVLYNCASVAVNRDRLDEAVSYAERSVAVFVQLQRPAEIVHAESYLGWLYNKAGRPADAERALRHTVALATGLGLKEERMNALHYLATAQREQGNAVEALVNFEAYMALKDSIGVEEQKRQLAEITGKWQNEKKESALLESKHKEAASREEAQRQRTLKFVYLGCALLLALSVVVLVSRYRLKRRTADALAVTNAEVVRQKERAEASERAKDRFLANMSHEIRTPLNAIMGFTGLLLEEPRDPRTARFLSSIREAGDNLLVVINDVLDISRIEAGRLVLLNEPFDLERCIASCTAILQHRAEEQRNVLIVESDPATPRWVTGDSARLTQILLNLLGNALKFTTDGTVRLHVAPTTTGVLFRVSDTGIGIPAAKLDLVFERFTQVDTNDQRRYGGTGLGLAIVKELVRLHDGTIHVESEPGRGTTFTVELPLHSSAAAAKVEQGHMVPSNRALNGHTILVVEDNDLNAVVTMETLKRHYPVSELVLAHNGREAVQSIMGDTDRKIALVLMDVQMPELDGMAATREVRSMGSRVPIIALTASVLASDLSQCIAAGMDACLTKPFKVQDLLKVIADLTGDGGKPATGPAPADPYTELFRALVPTRLRALQEAHAKDDQDEVRRIVHILRPQLIHHDADRFTAAIDAVLDADVPGPDWNAKVQRVVCAIEAAVE